MMAAIATDGKGNYLTLNASGDWVPTDAPAMKETGTAPEAVGDTVVSPDDVARVNAPPSQPPVTSIEDLRNRAQQTTVDMQKWFAPAPTASDTSTPASPEAPVTDTQGGPVFSPEDVGNFGRKAGATAVGLAAMPVNALLNALTFLEQGGPGRGGLTIDPNTNTLGMTPEAMTATQLLTPGVGYGGRDVRFSGADAFKRDPPSFLERHGERPMPVTMDELRGAMSRVPPEPPQNQMMPSEVAPPSGPVPQQPQAEPQPTAGDAAVPMTSDEARAVASSYYQRFDKAAQDGGSLNPQATDRFIASVEAVAPKPGIGQAVAGPNEITELAKRLQDYKGQPMSLEDAHTVDQQIGHLISANYVKAPSISRQLQDIQQKFRDQISNPEPGDVVSGQAGLDALAPARKAYSQAIKLETIERIQQRALDTDNPTTSFRTQIRTLLNNDRMSRGFSDEEKDALRDAANRGVAGSALHLLGSRLIPIITGSAGGGITGAALGYGLNEAARAGANALAANRLKNAYTILGKSVPPNPQGP